MLSGPLLLAVVEALSLHFLLRTKDAQIESLKPVVAALLFAPALPVVLCSTPSAIDTIRVYIVFYSTISLSIIFYRLSPFHPLYGYPSPLLCRLTKLWAVRKSWNGKLHLYYKRLHDKYGPIVRVGPNELSILDVDLIPQILSMPRGPMWDGRSITPAPAAAQSSMKNNSLISVRDQARHAQLRKPWNRAFGPEPMKDYNTFLVRRAAIFIERLASMAGQDIDIASWISYFSFDFMGDLAFGEGFDLMQNEDQDGLWKIMKDGLFLPSILQHIPWLTSLLRSMPWTSRKTQKFGAFAVQRARARISKDLKQKDLFFHLADRSDGNDEYSSPAMIISNTVLAIIGGSDTTASVLSNIVYFLLCNPKELKTLCDELHAIVQFHEDDINADALHKLENLPQLNAVINETLRLQPPLPSGLQRAPPQGSGGRLIGKHFVAEGTAISVPPYALHRDHRYFSPDPDRFWPGRWLGQGADSPVVTERKAFIPFSSGPNNCAGKPLALVELRYLTALIFSRFELSFKTGWDVSSWERNLEDRFTLAKGPLMVRISERSH